MSRHGVTCAALALPVIAVATTAVWFASPDFSHINDLTEAANSLKTDISQRRQELNRRLRDIVAFVSAETRTTPETPEVAVAAALPAAPGDETLPAVPDAETQERSVAADSAAPVDATINVSEPFVPPAPTVLAEETPQPPLMEKSAPVTPPPAAEIIVAAAPEPPASSPASAAEPEPEVKNLAELPAELPTPAGVGAPDIPVTTPAPALAPAPVEKPKLAREDKPEEKQIFASLGLPATSTIDTPPTAADRLAAAEANAQPAPAEAEELADASLTSSPGETSNLPQSTPLKLRALTRADIPPPEKFASLGSPVQTGARNTLAPALSGVQPPEQQRVAYDAPVVAEEPTSIGKRRYVDDTKYTGLGSPEALLEALRHVGANARSLGLPPSLWCADFMNLVLRKSGLNATGSRAARSYLQYGKKIDEPRVGAIAIFSRGRNSGHIGIVRGTDGNGNPIIVSGNHNHKVAEAVYPKARVIAYVVPR